MTGWEDTIELGPYGEATELLLRYARAAHRAGYPTNELEPRLVDLGRALELPSVQVSSNPTVLELTIGAIPLQRSWTLRVQPSAVDLDAVALLDELAVDMLDGRVDHAEAIERLKGLDDERLERPLWLVVAAYGVSGSSLAVVLGGGWRETLAAALVGLAVGTVASLGIRGDRSDAVVTPVAALVASFTAALLAYSGLEIRVDDVTLAALVALLPGMTLTIGMRELATDQLQSGLANTAKALIRLLGLVFGVAAGASLAESWFGAVPLATVHPFPEGAEFVAAIFAGLAFVVSLRAPRRDAIWTCSAALLAVTASALASDVFGDVAGVFAAALAVGLAGNTLARRRRRSPLVFIVPGVLMLVPGSTGFESAAELLAEQTVSGIDAAFETFVTALAIVYGLVVSELVLPTARRPPLE